MRPRHIAAENTGLPPVSISGMYCFNEAAAYSRGKQYLQKDAGALKLGLQ